MIKKQTKLKGKMRFGLAPDLWQTDTPKRILDESIQSNRKASCGFLL